jgi:hypothetical protein
MSGLADRLDHDGDGARLAIEIGNGERNAFAVLVDAGHDEVAGPGSACHVGCENVPKEGGWSELLPALDEKHNTPWNDQDTKY